MHNSAHLKSLALLLVVSVLSLSFKIPGSNGVILNAGTNIPLETVSMIQSDLVSVGQIIDFRVKYDVKVDEKNSSSRRLNS